MQCPNKDSSANLCVYVCVYVCGAAQLVSLMQGEFQNQWTDTSGHLIVLKT